MRLHNEKYMTAFDKKSAWCLHFQPVDCKDIATIVELKTNIAACVNNLVPNFYILQIFAAEEYEHYDSSKKII